MKIIISIVSWNYLPYLEKEIPLLLNGLGEDDLVQVIETGKRKHNFSFSHEQLKIERSSENNGYAAAHKRSVSIMLEKEFDGILLLNPDIQFSESIISKLKERISQTKNESIIGAPIFNLNKGKLELEYGGFPLLKINEEALRKAKYDAKLKNIILQHHEYDVNDLHGSFVYFPRTIIEQNGWMDSSYFLYGEENEYLHRLKKSNVSIKIFSELAILHENGGTFSFNDDLKKIREYYRTRNRLFNNLKFYGKKAYTKINYLFLLKYLIGRHLLRIDRFTINDLNYYNFLGHIHFFKGIRGKTFDPNDYDY